MKAIKAITNCDRHDSSIIVRRRSTHKTCLSNAMRKAMRISLKATRWLCQQMQQEYCEGVGSITTILIPWWQLLSQEHLLPRVSLTDARRRHSTRETSGRLGKFMPQISHEECGINNNTNKKRTCNKKKQLSWHVRHVSRATIAGQSANWVTWQSQWCRPKWLKNKREQRKQKLPFC